MKFRVWLIMAWRAQLSKNLKELRVLLCQTSPASAEARYLIYLWFCDRWLFFRFILCVFFLNSAFMLFYHELGFWVIFLWIVLELLLRKITRNWRHWTPNCQSWFVRPVAWSLNFGPDMVRNAFEMCSWTFSYFLPLCDYCLFHDGVRALFSPLILLCCVCYCLCAVILEKGRRRLFVSFPGVSFLSLCFFMLYYYVKKLAFWLGCLCFLSNRLCFDIRWCEIWISFSVVELRWLLTMILV